MKRYVYLILFTLAILFYGCPYESKVAIVHPIEALKIDKDLKDQWVAFHEGGAREEILFTKTSKTVYEVNHKQYAPKNKLIANFKYKAYATYINESVVFNIENEDGKYLFAKYGWTGKNEFYIEAANKEFMAKNFKVDSVTTENLRSFLSENINNSKLFDEKIEFHRKYSPEYEKVKMFMRKSGF